MLGLYFVLLAGGVATKLLLDPASGSHQSTMDELVKTLPLFTPDLHELAKVLQEGLETAFEDVDVTVADCPDLRKDPFYLVGEGFGGRPRLVDVGGVPYLIPFVQRDKIYKFDTIAEQIKLPGAFMVGAGAGPFHLIGTNSELVANVRIKGGPNAASNDSYFVKMNPATGRPEVIKDRAINDFALMVNLLATEGNPGKVLQVKVARRTRETNLITCMRESVKQKYGTKPIGLGGAFVLQNGKAKMHVMPDFPDYPMPNDAAVNKWLFFDNMTAPLVCVGTFVSHDPGFGLREEHFHGFSMHGEGGHYHEDTTPEDAQYLGYFTPADILYRIDRPANGSNQLEEP